LLLPAEGFKVGHVGLVVLGDVRNDSPGETHLLGSLAPYAVQRLALDRAPALEIRKRRHRNASFTCLRSRGDLTHVGLDVLLRDPAAWCATLHLGEVHA